MLVPLGDRVTEVIADLGQDAEPRYRYGSGCIVKGRTVLTAAHVVAGAQVVWLRRPDKTLSSAKVDRRFIGGGSSPDLALIEFDDNTIDLPAIEVAVLDRDSQASAPVESCQVVGYPQFAKRPSGRETAQAYGQIPVLAGLVSGLLTVQVSAPPEPLPPQRTALGDTAWSGISGAPVVADGCLLGVITEHAPREGPSSIIAVPVSALNHNPEHPDWGPGVGNASEWWARLGVTGLDALRRLPKRKTRPEPPYRATVRDIHGRTAQLLGREKELAEIADFATGSGSYKWLTGEAWTGKTGLAAEVCTTANPPSVDVVAYFLSRREANADSNHFLAELVPQLAYLLDEDPPAPALDQFRGLWERAVKRAMASGRHLLLVVDGLDEDLRPPGLPSVAAILPANAGGRAHVLVTSRPNPAMQRQLPPGHPLRTISPVELEPSPHAQQLADLAELEIDTLLHGEDEDLAAEVLGVLAAAAGPLAVIDIATLTSGETSATAAHVRRVSRLVTEKAARSLQPVGPADDRRYQFAHVSLLAQAQANDWLRNPGYRRRIGQWADQWRDAGWPMLPTDYATPLYLLDSYAATLTNQPKRLAVLVSDVGWVAAAVHAAGVDSVLAALRTACSAVPAHAGVSGMLAAVQGQAHHLRPPEPVSQPSYVLRQLCLEAAVLGDDDLAAAFRAKLRALADPGPVPLWTSRRSRGIPSAELGSAYGWVWAAAVLPDGRVVTGEADGQLEVWDPGAKGTAPLRLESNGGMIRAVAVLPDGRIVTGQEDGRLLIWVLASPGAAPVELGRHKGMVHAVAVLPDGQVVSAGDDGRVRIWNPGAPGAAPIELGNHADRVLAAAALPCERVVTGGADGRVLIWNRAAAGAAPIELGSHDDWVRAIALLPDGQVITGGDDGGIRVWNPAVPGAAVLKLGARDDWVRAIALLPDGRVATCGDDGRVRVWDPAAGQGPFELGDHDAHLFAVAVLPDGRVITGGNDRRLLIWDPAVAAVGGPDAGDRPVLTMAVLPDGRVVTGGTDGRVKVTDPASADALPLELGCHNDFVRGVAVLPEERIVTGGEDGRVLVWDLGAPGAAPLELGSHDGKVWAVAVLPGERVVTGGEDGRVLVWDLATAGISPLELGNHDADALAVTVLPGERVVTGGMDRRVLVWDPAKPGAPPLELGNHDGFVAVVAVLPGERVVTGGEDGRVLVWDLGAPGAAPLELGSHDGKVWAVAVLPGERVVTGGRDHRVRIWDVMGQAELISIACSVGALAIGPRSTSDDCQLMVSFESSGISGWSIPGRSPT